jgi:hypothetical protein
MRFSLVENRIAGALVGTAGALAFVLMADDPAGYRSAVGVVGLAVGLVCLVLAVRGARLAVVVTADSVIVRNLFLTHNIARRDVARIILRPGTAVPPKLIRVGGDGRIRLDALSPGLLRLNGNRAERLVGALGQKLGVATETA